MSDLDGTLEAITLEHLNHANSPQRITVTAEGFTTFVRGAMGWVPMRMLRTPNTTDRLPAMTARQMKTTAFQLERMGWKEIGLSHHGLPDAGIVQR